MSEDWDESVPVQAPQGRIFGMRGRGFRPVEESVELPHGRSKGCADREINVGVEYKTSRKDYSSKMSSDENDPYYMDDAHDDSSFNRPIRRDGGSRPGGRRMHGHNARSNDDPESNKPKRQDYIPQEILENEDLFSGGISTGINFDKYDDIEVKVSGENIPEKIEHFGKAGLVPLLYSNIKKCCYEKPTPIQKYALPIVMSGRDMMACAQTGSGKTAAFIIPLINSLLQSGSNPTTDGGSASPQLLIITPTRELAIQIYIEARKFTYGSDIKVEITYGGTAVHYQLSRVKKGCNILIATPGRLNDFVKRRALTLDKVRHLVVDEADRMLDMSFLPEIEPVLNGSSTNTNEVQILMFSATFPSGVQQLAAKYLKHYLFLTVGIVGGACADVEQKFYMVSKFDKRPKLIELLKETGYGKTLVFVQKKRTADIIAAFLSEKDFPATSMHGDREQMLREEALNDFKSGKMDILVATAVAARGLDIKDVSHVINFDLPSSIDEYVHRIGRTGRVGNRGLATSFFDPETDSSLAPDLVRILVQAHQEVPEFLRDCDIVSSQSVSMSRFGGRDIRKRGLKEVDVVLESADTYEEEEWS